MTEVFAATVAIAAVPFTIAAVKGRYIVGLAGFAFFVATAATDYGGDIFGTVRFLCLCAAIYYAIVLAKPGSYWDREFYDEEKQQRARQKERWGKSRNAPSSAENSEDHPDPHSPDERKPEG